MNHTKTFTLHRGNSKALDKSYELYKKNHPDEYNTMSKHANRLIKDGLDMEKIQNKLAKAFKIIAVVDGELVMKDRETKTTYIITRDDGKLYCDKDKSHNCTHVVACYSFPQTARLFKDGDKELEDLPLEK